MYSKLFKATAGVMPHLVWARAIKCGSDLSVIVGGGTQAHIGAVSLGVYEPVRDSATVSTVTVHTHRDDAVAAYFAKNLSREIKCTVSVSAGIHVDEAGEEDIALLRKNSEKCCTELVAILKESEE